MIEPTPEEISLTRQAAGGISYPRTAELIARLEESDWAQVKEYLDLWLKVRFDNTELVGSILGANISPAKARLMIRNFVRDALGLPLVSSLAMIEDEHESGNVSTVTQIF